MAVRIFGAAGFHACPYGRFEGFASIDIESMVAEHHRTAGIGIRDREFAVGAAFGYAVIHRRPFRLLLPKHIAGRSDDAFVRVSNDGSPARLPLRCPDRLSLLLLLLLLSRNRRTALYTLAADWIEPWRTVAFGMRWHSNDHQTQQQHGQDERPQIHVPRRSGLARY